MLTRIGMNDLLFYFCGSNQVISSKEIGLSDNDIISIVKEKILNGWSRYFKVDKPEDIFCLLVKRGPRKLLFFFIDHATIPCVCAKLTTAGDSYSAFLHEYEKLQDSQKDLSDFCRKRIPTPLFKIEKDEELAIAMSYVDGKVIKPNRIAGCSFRNFRKDRKIIKKVYDWWENYLEHSSRIILFDKQLFMNRIEKDEKYFFSSFPNDTRLKKELSGIKEIISELDKTNIRVGPVHGDFWKGNMLCYKKKIYILDWERCRDQDLPIFDMFLFCTTFYDENNGIQDFSKTLLEDSGYSKIIRNLLHKATIYLCLNSTLAKIMFEVFLIEMCIQGSIHYNKKTEFDAEWKTRLDFFLDNKEMILTRTFNPEK